MSFRTPLIQPRSQYHAYWGRYAYAVGAGVWANGSNLLPGAPGNVISAVEFAKLEVGDTSATSDALVANQDLYVCVDVSGGNGLVEWRRLGNAGLAIQTVRDAHVIVVAQTGHLATLFAATPPPANRLNLGAAGDIVSVTCDFLDPGNGSELQLALAAAAAAGVPVDIRLRPMELTLTAATVGASGFVVPSNCRLIGGGRTVSRLIGTDGGAAAATQTVVTLGPGASIEDLAVESPAPTAAPAGAQVGVVEAEADGKVLRCEVTLVGSVAFNRTATTGINFALLSGGELVDDCLLLIDSLFDQPVPAASVGVLFGQAAVSGFTDQDSEVRNTYIDEATTGVGSASIGVEFVNCEGGRAFNVEHVRARRPVGSFVWGWSVSPGAPEVRNVRGPKFIECRVDTTDDEASSQSGFVILISGTPDLAQSGISEAMIHDCVVRFATPTNTNPAISKVAFRVANIALDATSFRNLTIDNCKAVRSHRGFVIDASGVTTVGLIESVRMTACQARGTLGTGSATARGCILRSNLAVVNLTRVGVQNCDFSDTAAGGTSLEIGSAGETGVTDTIALGNNLTTAVGTALTDNGTGTEAAHNIL